MESGKKSSSKNPSVKLAIGITCAALSVSQLICEYFNFSLPLNLLVDVLSVVIAFFASCKILSSDNENEDILQNAEKIKDEINSNLKPKNNEKTDKNN